jgi:hypothetical protein
VLAVPPGSLQEWRKRLLEKKVEIVGRSWAFGEEYLCVIDPEGLEQALAEEVDDAQRGDLLQSFSQVPAALRMFQAPRGLPNFATDPLNLYGSAVSVLTWDHQR